jgi:phosphoglycolate phosphatase-like HAD superfamily hydrolase
MARLSDIRAILFDTDGVIYHHPRRQRYLTAFLADHGLKPRHPSILERALRAARFDVVTGRITAETYFDAILRTHGIAAPELLEAGREALFQDAADIELYPGVIETLTHLQDSGLRLGAVVDSPYTAGEEIAWMAARMLSPGVWTVFIVSSDVGATKSEPLLFGRTLQRLNLRAEHAAFVGHASDELACAASLGMLTISFLPDDPDVETDYQISTIYGLEELFLH